MTNEEKQMMLDEMKKDQEGRTGERKYWSPPSKEEGTFRIRLLPPLSKKDETKFYFTHRVHWIDGEPFECLDQTLSDRNGNVHEARTCPICSFARKLYKTAERGDAEWKLAGEINKKDRRVSRVVVRGSEDETQAVFYEYGPTIFNILFHIMTETDFGIIVDPKNGRDFNLTKVGTGRRSRYDTSTPAANETQIFETIEQLKDVFTNAMKLDYNSLIEFKSAEEMSAALNNFLGVENSSKKVEVVSDTSKDEPDVEDETEDADSEIDAILDEFTND